jgi:hypothetical protein
MTTKKVQQEWPTCPDCGVEIGQPHVNDCDVERCSVCGTQRISCSCVWHNPMRSIWSGVWPETPNTTTELTNGIRADAYTDDEMAVIEEFDATRYFEDSSDEEIMELAKCGWGGDYPADEVAQFMADHDDRLAKMFRYIEAAEEVSPDAPGLECHVNVEDAMAWIAEHRPHLSPKIQAWEEKIATAAGGERHE